jgi:hypothetical protein
MTRTPHPKVKFHKELKQQKWQDSVRVPANQRQFIKSIHKDCQLVMNSYFKESYGTVLLLAGRPVPMN